MSTVLKLNLRSTCSIGVSSTAYSFRYYSHSFTFNVRCPYKKNFFIFHPFNTVICKSLLLFKFKTIFWEMIFFSSHLFAFNVIIIIQLSLSKARPRMMECTTTRYVIIELFFLFFFCVPSSLLLPTSHLSFSFFSFLNKERREKKECTRWASNGRRGRMDIYYL